MGRRGNGALWFICKLFALQSFGVRQQLHFFIMELLLKWKSASKKAPGYFSVGIDILKISTDCFVEVATKSFQKY